MTAGIFAQHDVWYGSCRPPTRLNPKGYFENQPLKRIMKKHWPDVPTKGLALPVDGLRGEIDLCLRHDGYKGGPWFYKCTALYAPALFAAFPEAKAVCVVRDPESVFQSTRATNMFGVKMSDDELRANIAYHQGFMMGLVNWGAAPVYTDDLIDGDFTSIMAALEYCDIEPDPNLIGSFVDPKHWHYGS